MEKQQIKKYQQRVGAAYKLIGRIKRDLTQLLEDQTGEIDQDYQDLAQIPQHLAVVGAYLAGIEKKIKKITEKTGEQL